MDPENRSPEESGKALVVKGDDERRTIKSESAILADRSQKAVNYSGRKHSIRQCKGR